MDSSGNLYGTASAGGTANDGTVFELAQGSGTITTLASFNGTNGCRPDAGLVMDSSGNLYGTTYSRSASNDGTVFELAKGSGTITTLASFNGTNGYDPQAALIMDSSGNLYGTTSHGGASVETARFSSWPRAAARSPRWLRSTTPKVQNLGSRPDHGQQRQPLRHNSSGRRLERRHGVRAGPGQRHDHHRWLRSTAPTVHCPRPV